jgi:hypothetical protein
LAKELFVQLSKLGYKEIFLSVDGPRNDYDRFQQLKIIEEANLLFSDVRLNALTSNYGVSIGPVMALDWFFDNVDFGIVLEDDILPSRGFFNFVEEMHRKFDKVERVLTINGGSFSSKPESTDFMYYFSSYTHIWGWATWSYVWKQYNRDLSFSDIITVVDSVEWQSRGEKKYWLRNFKDYSFSWDFQLSFLSFKLQGLNITPTRTLCQNIGFDVDSSHVFIKDPIRERVAFNGSLPVNVPIELTANRRLDFLTFQETRSYNFYRVFRVLINNNPIKILKFCFRKFYS